MKGSPPRIARGVCGLFATPVQLSFETWLRPKNVMAMCMLARVGLISPAAKEAAGRRAVAMRLEEEMRRERRAQWMASLAGPGWARKGNCHRMY